MLRLASRAALPAVFALAAVAYGAQAATKAPLLGGPDKPITAGDSIEFTVKEGIGRDKDVFLEVASGNQTVDAGRLRTGTLPAEGNEKLSSFTRRMTYKKGKYTATLKASEYSQLAKDQFWAATPGTYYWSAFVVDCESSKDCVREAAKPNRIIVKPKPLAVAPTTRTSTP